MFTRYTRGSQSLRDWFTLSPGVHNHCQSCSHKHQRHIAKRVLFWAEGVIFRNRRAFHTAAGNTAKRRYEIPRAAATPQGQIHRSAQYLVEIQSLSSKLGILAIATRYLSIRSQNVRDQKLGEICRQNEREKCKFATASQLPSSQRAAAH